MIFTREDKENIENAIQAGGDIWNNDLLKEVKQKIKSYYRILQGEQCCYCRRSTRGEFRMVIDIEHVLPKKRFNIHMFNLKNLGVSCKRCNMRIKGEDISFFTGNLDNPDTHFNSSYYNFIHPNIDHYFAHIEYMVHIVNEKMMIKYNVLNNNAKGNFTYNYFKLSELEVDSFNQAQGIEGSESIDEAIDNETADRIETLLMYNGT